MPQITWHRFLVFIQESINSLILNRVLYLYLYTTLKRSSTNNISSDGDISNSMHSFEKKFQCAFRHHVSVLSPSPSNAANSGVTSLYLHLVTEVISIIQIGTPSQLVTT